MDTFLRDLRLTLRGLRKRPGFTVVALVTLAVGIGANATMFSLTAEVFLDTLPVERSDRLMAIYSASERDGATNLSSLPYENWVDLRRWNRSFSDVAAYEWMSINVDVARSDRVSDSSSSEGAEYLGGQLVSGNYFDTLGVQPLHGRLLTSEDDVELGAHPVVVVSHRYWTRRLGADPDAMGTELRINGHVFTVVGVAPPEFEGLMITGDPALWVPLKMHPFVLADMGYSLFEGNRRAHMLWTFGRLRDDVSREAAVQETAAIGQRLAAEYPQDNGDSTLFAEPLDKARVPPWIRGRLGAGTMLLGGMVGLVLLIVCVNLANLLLTRATERRGEIAIRLALGIDRRRLLAQLVTESLVLSVLGGVAGLGVAWLTRRVLVARLSEATLPTRMPAFELDGGVFAFTFLVAGIAGIFFGTIPALQSWRLDFAESIRGGSSRIGGGSARGRQLLVVAQVALSVVLLFIAGLFLRSLEQAQRIDPGFESERLVIAAMDIGISGYSQAEGEVFYRRVVEEAEALPGVERAVLSQAQPLGFGWYRRVTRPGEDDPTRGRPVESNVVGAGYFETLGIQVERGRAFREADRGRPEVAVVNRRFAETTWPGEDPLGRRFRIRSSRTDYTVEVIGVVADVDTTELGQTPAPYVYLPSYLEYRPDMVLVARTAGDPAPLLAPLRRTLVEMDRGLAIASVHTVGLIFERALWSTRATSSLLGAFGSFALLLAAVGLYGVMAHAVAARRRELGIRVAVGASRQDLCTMIFRQSLFLAAVGLFTGLALALGAAQIFRTMLYTEPTDPFAFAGTAGVLVLVAALATAVPALRAMRTDPVVALRTE